MPILARNLKFRIEAAECIRELIEEIRLVPENGKLRVKLCGNWSATEECDEKYGKVFLILTLLLPFAVLVSSASLAESKLEATIFSYDGKELQHAGHHRRSTGIVRQT
jgi:hypothetical protein